MSNDTAEPKETAPTEAESTTGTVPPLETDIETLKAQAARAAEHWERLVRTTADFDNFKKRAAREREEAVRIGAERVLLRLLPVADSFEMAMTAASATGAEVGALRTGVAMVQSQLRAVLTECGAEEVEALGRAFDPAVHEAVSEQDSADVPEGHVMQQLRKGYRMKDRLLRPATVVVARKPAA